MTQPIRTITIGVTGRRHIAPYAIREIEKATQQLFERLARVVDARFVLETGLAIGADSIAAKAAVAANRRKKSAKIYVRAVLPMPRADYEDDFKSDALPGELSERAAFRALLAACDDVVELPIVTRRARGEFSRVDQYVALAERLVRNSDLLLAYWNPENPTFKPGGTVDVVTRKLADVKARNEGLVFSIGTPENVREKTGNGEKIYRPENMTRFGGFALNDGELLPSELAQSALDALVKALRVTLLDT